MDYFFDPILRGPTIGTMLISFATALIGVLVFVKHRCLVGEALSHACYPGVVIAVAFAAFIGVDTEFKTLLFVFGGAIFVALIALATMHYLEKRWQLTADLTLAITLSCFFGVGVLSFSLLQQEFPAYAQQVQLYLFGQAATMTDSDLLLYGALVFFVLLLLTVFYKQIQVVVFDDLFAKTQGFSLRVVRSLISLLLVGALVMGMRSVGLVLVSAMLVAPVVAARQWTHSLFVLFLLSGAFGLLSGWLGSVFSFELSQQLDLSLPTGPMIVVTAASLAFLSLLIAPERGIFMQFVRMNRFRRTCIRENLLKLLWRAPDGLSLHALHSMQILRGLRLKVFLWQLQKQGLVEAVPYHLYRLTEKGKIAAAKIVRCHRLWEAYLVQDLGIGKEHVHVSAEEMEHILTPEIEQELKEMLAHPEKDPHQQSIPL